MKWAFWIFVALYAAAFLLYLIGTFGWFGQEKDPLSAVFLMPLGLPWNLVGDRIGLGGPLLGLLSPAINAGILYWLWRRLMEKAAAPRTDRASDPACRSAHLAALH